MRLTRILLLKQAINGSVFWNTSDLPARCMLVKSGSGHIKIRVTML